MCCIHPDHSTAARPAQTAAPARLQFTVSHCHDDSINMKQCWVTLHVHHFQNVVGKSNSLALSSPLSSRLITKSITNVVKFCTRSAIMSGMRRYGSQQVVGTAQHSTAQHSTAQHSTAQHSTAQHSTACLTFWPWNWLIMRAPQP